MHNLSQAWKSPRDAEHRGELPSLSRRIARYLDRIKHGHPLKGRAPGRDAIELWSNDYLALSGHPAIVRAQVNVLEGGGDDLFMSAAYLSERTPQRIVERKMAAFLGVEDSVICQSGWCANVGLVQSIAHKDTPVYIDVMAHASLWEGARSAGAPIRPFRHNDPESLETQIRKFGPGVIVVDAVYSIDGSVCPLPEVAEIGACYGCIVVVDESHSIGVWGDMGRGMVSQLGLADRVHYRTFSLSKAFVTRAGVVAGPARVMKFFPYESRPAIFSSAVLPHEMAGLDAALSVIREDEWRREKLKRNADDLRGRLGEMGYNVDDSRSQIMALEVGFERQTTVLRDALERHGIFGAVFCPPATPKNRSLIRFSVNCGLGERELDRVVEVCRAIRDEVAMRQWPSTRRKERGERATGGPVALDPLSASA